jgi:hypothetical protein
VSAINVAQPGVTDFCDGHRHRAHRALQLKAPDPAAGLTMWMRAEQAALID